MTKEQEAIERLETIDETVKEYDGNILKADIYTVLNMLKEKDSEIERLKQALARNIAKNFTSSMKESAKSKEDLEMLNAGWQIELKKKDKMVDLLIDYVDKLSEYYTKIEGKNNDFCDEKCINKNIDCYDCIKQYFERKASE